MDNWYIRKSWVTLFMPLKSFLSLSFSSVLTGQMWKFVLKILWDMKMLSKCQLSIIIKIIVLYVTSSNPLSISPCQDWIPGQHIKLFALKIMLFRLFFISWRVSLLKVLYDNWYSSEKSSASAHSLFLIPFLLSFLVNVFFRLPLN